MRIGKGHSYYVDNLAFFKEPNNRTNEAVQARIAALKKEDFIRLPEFEVRRQIQKEKFKLPIFTNYNNWFISSNQRSKS